MHRTYNEVESGYRKAYYRDSAEESREEAIRYSPLVSVAVQYLIDEPHPQINNEPDKASASASLGIEGGTAAVPVSPASSAVGGLPLRPAQPRSKSNEQQIGKDATGTSNGDAVKPSGLMASRFARAPEDGVTASTPVAASTQVSRPAHENDPATVSVVFGEGTTKIPFTPTFREEDQVTFQNITFQSMYRKKSQEELRLEDYDLGRRYAHDPVLPQYSLLGFDLGTGGAGKESNSILLNTNAPSSFFLCGSQGSGKSYTLSCMLENHLLEDASTGVQRETIPGFVFHYDTNTSGYLAEAMSLCSRGIKVRVLVSWSNYQAMKEMYEKKAAEYGSTVEVRPLLFQDQELTIEHIRDLMAFGDASSGVPLYLEVIQTLLRRILRVDRKMSVQKFLDNVGDERFAPSQQSMLDQRLNLLKTFSATTTPLIVEQDFPNLRGKALKHKKTEQGVSFEGDCIRVEKGTLTIVDLSDPFVDPNTACTLFNICLSIIIKRHKEAVEAQRISKGFIVTLDEAHKFLDTELPAAEVFTQSLLTCIREQRHNAARIVIATQEPSISPKLLDLCSVSIIHRFNSPAWFEAIRGHLGGASDLIPAEDSEDGETKVDSKRSDLFQRIVALNPGESLVFSPTSWVRGGEVAGGGTPVPPRMLGSGTLWMKTRRREGEDAGKTATTM